MNAYRFARRAQSRLGALLVAALMLALTTGVGSASAQRASASAGISARDGVPAVGLLARGSGYAGRTGSPQVRALQRRLRGLDDNPGAIDGLYGPLTQAAVERFQATHGLAVDGIAGPQTQHVLRRARAARTLTLGTGYDTPGGSTQVRALQHHLHAAGQHPGPIDGLYGPQTQAAVEHYQTTHHLTADGIAGPQTARRVLSRTLAHPGSRRPTAGPPGRPDLRVHPAPRSLAKPANEPVPVLVLALAAWLIALALIALRTQRRAKPPTTTTDPPPDDGDGPAEPGTAGLLAVTAAGGADPPPEDRDGAPEPGTAGRLPITENSRAVGGVDLPVLGYVLVRDSADHNGDGFRIDADAIDHACEARGLRLIELVRDREANNGESAPRPGLSHALERVAAGEAGGLVVARLEHLGSSATELGTLIERVSSLDARLIAADQGLDTGTDRGRRAARTLASISRLEPDEPAQHTHRQIAPARAAYTRPTKKTPRDRLPFIDPPGPAAQTEGASSKERRRHG